MCLLAGNIVSPYRHKSLRMKSLFATHYIERLGEVGTHGRRFLGKVWMNWRDD